MRIHNLLMPSVILVGAAVLVIPGAAQRIKQPLPSSVGNLLEAKVIEIKDASGQVVLNGKFVTSSDTRDETELSASLVGGGNAAGKAEIEVAKANNTATSQELEVGLRKLAPASTFKLVVDGREFATFATNKSGKADLKLSTKIR